MDTRYTTDNITTVDFGPRPWYLADRLTEADPNTMSKTGSQYTSRRDTLQHLSDQLSWDKCPGPHQREFASMALGGAAMQLPAWP